MTNSNFESVKKDINLGVFWLVALRIVLKSISVVSTLILVRLLLPEDFGLVALAMSFYALIELMSAFGFEAAIVQTRNAKAGHYSTIWTIRFILSGFMCLTTFFAAPWVADFYSEPQLTHLLQLCSFLFVLKAATNPGMISFIKEMDFKMEFRYQGIAKLSSFFVTIAAAWWLRNYYALIIGMYASTIISVGLSYYYSKFRPTFCLTYARELMNFSKWMFVNAWLNYLNTRTGEIVLGYFGSSKIVGLFNVSYEISSLPSNELGAAINRSSFSGYSKAQGNIPLLRNLFHDVLGNTSIVAFSTSLGIFLLAYELSHWLLGPGWESTQIVFEYIAIASIFRALSTNHQYVYMSLGKPRLTTMLSAIHAVLLFVLLIPLTYVEGLAGAAKAYLYTSILYYPLPMLITKRLINFSFKEYLKTIFRHLLAGVAMVVGTQFVVEQAQFTHNPMFFSLLIKICLGAIVFVSVLYLLWLMDGRPVNTSEGQMFTFVKRKIKGSALANQ
ncbi:lipopolysaccharide biosynthesis protein [Thalassotalea euphylliae]|uniref:Lipopolysaccharide biosynthesis protein n=1 Tax=Thalassotalea euphylliae TaxID=1655234 RepID=A0A3E0TM14_9GAMM|nr:lipopolysaccharide biosynthesis protein [Thalassotalea euphylliae]REL25212.1 lipopolysaccharide biosynthesis protein [Thalassotalea euphylliae]